MALRRYRTKTSQTRICPFLQGGNEFPRYVESPNSLRSLADPEAPPGHDSVVVRVIPMHARTISSQCLLPQQEEFFTENGELLLPPIAGPRLPSIKWARSRPSPSSTPSKPGWASRNFSLTSLGSSLSTDTFLTHDPNHTINLTELCGVINRHRSLQNANIVSAEGYCRSIGRTGIVHRFIVLELERCGRQRIWLRIDRRMGKEDPIVFITRVATSPAMIK